MIRYDAVKAMLEAKGYAVFRFVFDCGETIDVRDPNLLIVSVARECGDIETATEAVVTQMSAMGLLTAEDIARAAAYSA